MNPARVLVEQLAAARRRGLSFEDAFPAAVSAAVSVADRDERTQWRAALADLRESWQACWERRPPTKAENALAMLAAGEEPVQVLERVRERVLA